jgi:ribosomal protein L21E
MVRRKKIRTRGKLSLSRYFQRLNIGDSVSVVREKAQKGSFPQRLQGRTGVIQGKRGRVQIVKIKDQNKEKVYLIHPIHLKKIKTKK